MKLSKIKPNKANPRFIRDGKFAKLKHSIEEFPAMMELRPIVVDTDGTILGGNMRYKAISDLGYTDIPDTWVKVADHLTDEEKQRFIIEDNVAFGEWNMDALANEWDFSDLENWGVDLPDITTTDSTDEDEENEEELKTITLKFTDDEHAFVKKELAKIDKSIEIALLNLLGYT